MKSTYEFRMDTIPQQTEGSDEKTVSYTMALTTGDDPEKALDTMRLFVTHIMVTLKSIGNVMAEEDVNQALSRFMDQGNEDYEGMEG